MVLILIHVYLCVLPIPTEKEDGGEEKEAKTKNFRTSNLMADRRKPKEPHR